MTVFYNEILNSYNETNLTENPKEKLFSVWIGIIYFPEVLFSWVSKHYHFLTRILLGEKQISTRFYTLIWDYITWLLDMTFFKLPVISEWLVRKSNLYNVYCPVRM